MKAIVTPVEMAAIDAAATDKVDQLVHRAGGAVARAATSMLGGCYGRRVVVVAGPGNNGNDGRDAASRLVRRGARVRVIEVADLPGVLPAADLVIDAGFGTGFRGEFVAPRLGGEDTPVLAVDIPSGVSGLTGEASGAPLPAARTVTFAGLKPGLLIADGPALSGEVVLADIGLDVSGARAHLVEQADVACWVPQRPRDAHKWRSAAWVVAGSPRMTGAAHLATRAAQRSGAGYVRLSSPGLEVDPGRPVEAVGEPLPGDGWAAEVLSGLERFRVLAVGPGLGTGPTVTRSVREVVAGTAVGLVVDGDGLTALGGEAAAVLASRPPEAPLAVLTPHEGELGRVAGAVRPTDPDRFEVVRAVAASLGAVVLLKGPVTLVAHPDGRVLATATGDQRLATAGTGDVLTGVITGLLAGGADPFEAAAAGAWLHGRAGALASPRGLVAGDLVDHLPDVLSELNREPPWRATSSNPS